MKQIHFLLCCIFLLNANLVISTEIAETETDLQAGNYSPKQLEVDYLDSDGEEVDEFKDLVLIGKPSRNSRKKEQETPRAPASYSKKVLRNFVQDIIQKAQLGDSYAIDYLRAHPEIYLSARVLQKINDVEFWRKEGPTKEFAPNVVYASFIEKLKNGQN